MMSYPNLNKFVRIQELEKMSLVLQRLIEVMQCGLYILVYFLWRLPQSFLSGSATGCVQSVRLVENKVTLPFIIC
jgi:hypothetical protein